MCHRVTCSHYLNEKKINDTYFHGHLDRQISKGYCAIEEKSKIICHYCQQAVSCIAVCSCMVYYILPIDVSMTRLAIHIGEHCHNVQQGTKRASIEKIRSLVRKVLKVENGGLRRVQMQVARQILFESLTKEDKMEAIDKDLDHFLEELMPLVQNRR